jgi:nitroreductase
MTLSQPNSNPARERPLSEVIAERHATPHFGPQAVPDGDLLRILRAGLQAPSGYNLQPWRFVVVRDPEQKKRLRQAANGQPKVEEAAVVIVACGDTAGWRTGDLEEVQRMGTERGIGTPESRAKTCERISIILSGQASTSGGFDGNVHVWVNRQVMIAFTTMMWMAEALGYDTAPMEGFLEDKMREVLHLPASVRVVALLALGKRQGPDKPEGGRFEMSRTCFAEQWGRPLDL